VATLAPPAKSPDKGLGRVGEGSCLLAG
jgi:hypothetical protein